MYAPVQNWKLAEIFFLRRIEWCPKKIVLIVRILENTVSSGKNKQTNKKKPQEFVWKFIEKPMKIHETEIPQPATKEDKYCLFMIAKPLADR